MQVKRVAVEDKEPQAVQKPKARLESKGQEVGNGMRHAFQKGLAVEDSELEPVQDLHARLETDQGAQAG
jgi:hypothetical protein